MTVWVWPLVIEFEPPGKLLNMNDRVHYQARGRAVRLWREAAFYAACQRLPFGPSGRRLPEGRYRVSITLPVKGNLHRDPSNYHATCKAVIDSLVSSDRSQNPGANLFEDDSAEFVTVAEPVLEVGGKVVRVSIEPAEISSPT